MWDLYGPALAAVYAKGQFHDIAFAKFFTPADRDSALRLLQQRQYKEGGNKVWMKADNPMDVRVLRSFVYGMKHNLGAYYETPKTASGQL